MFNFYKTIKQHITNIYMFMTFLLTGKDPKSELQAKLIKTIINSSDPEELKNKIVREITTALNAYRCFVVEYDSTTNNFKKITNAFNAQREAPSILGFDIEKNIPNLAMKRKYINSIVINNTKDFIKENHLENTNEEKYFNTYKIKASITLRLAFAEKLLGVLAIHYDKAQPMLSTVNLNYLKNIAEYISIALYLSTLYSEEKQEKEKEYLLRSIISIMGEGHDLAETTKKISEILSTIYDVHSLFINADTENYKTLYFYDFCGDKTKSEESKCKAELADISIYEQSCFDSIKNKIHYIEDTHNFILQHTLENTKIEEYFLHNDIKSLILFPILIKNSPAGLFIIHLKKSNQIKNNDLSFIKTITNQLAIAIKLAQDFEKERKTAERETILRLIISKIRSSLELEQIQNEIVNQIGKYFNADSVRIADFDYSTGDYTISKYSEYMSSENIKSWIGINFKEFPGFIERIRDVHLSGKNIIFNDLEDYLDENNLRNSEVENFYREFGFVSSASINIYHQNLYVGNFVLTFEHKRVFSEDEIEFIKALADQAGVVFYQAKLYKKEKEIADREILLRKIIEKIRNSLNIEETLSFICKEIAKLFNVQRVVLAVFPNPENLEKIILRKEYITSPDIIGLQAEDLKILSETFWLKLGKTINVLAFDNINDPSLPDFIKEPYSRLGIKSLIGSSIKKGENIWGLLILSEYKKFRHWNEEEKILLKTLADQLYLAINQAELYHQLKIKAENERTLREIMLSSVETFNIETVINSIVTKAGKLFNADRCFFIELDLETNLNLPINSYAEYLSSKEILSHITRVPKKEEIEIFIKQSKKQSVDYSEDITKEDLPEATKKMLIDDLSVKSYLIIPIFYGETIYGSLIFHYVRDYKTFSKEEIDTAVTIANQSAIVLHQAELYKITQKQAETERFNRKILEILRNTLDKATIKQLFVRNVGKYFNADRVFFASYDTEKKIYLPVDEKSEYLSSPKEKSFVNYDWSDGDLNEYIQPLLNKRELRIPCWKDYIIENHRSKGFIARFEEAQVQSSYNLPVMYEEKIMGYFCIEFTQDNCKNLSEDDINRIRSMCTQAGIALYHAELYLTTQKALSSQRTIIEKIEKPTSEILDTAMLLSTNEFEHDKQIGYLNNIINSCNKLLELTNND